MGVKIEGSWGKYWRKILIELDKEVFIINLVFIINFLSYITLSIKPYYGPYH